LVKVEGEEERDVQPLSSAEDHLDYLPSGLLMTPRRKAETSASTAVVAAT
jgi:hypothetical protein